MRLYLYTTVLTGLMFPLLAKLIWPVETTAAFLSDMFALYLTAGTALLSGATLWAFRTLSAALPVAFRHFFVRYIGAEVAAALSVGLLLTQVWIENGVWVALNFGGFLVLQMPAFFAAYLSYNIVQRLVGKITVDT